MKLDTKSIFARASAEEISVDPLLVFVTLNHAALWQAVRFLGGYEAARVVERCIALLERDGRVTPRARMMIEQIHSVLTLDRVDDPELPYMGFFAAIDPADPVVEEICLLCDGLGTAMADAAQIERQGTGAPPKPRAA